MAGLKRTAENQLTREELDEDDEIMEIAPPEGFTKADTNVLASRPMKGLPKRTNAAAGATFDAPTSKKLESGIGSNPFGIPSSPFTFSTPTLPSVPQTEQAAPANTPFKFTSAVSPSATATTKLMSNIMNSLPQPNGTHTNKPVEKSSPRSKNDDAEMTYYASLRGLNESVRSSIDEWMEADPFADLSAALHDQYKEYRSNIQKEYEESKKSRTATRVNGIPATSSPGSKPVPTAPQAPAAALSMPAPPKAFTFAGSSITISPSNSVTPGPTVGGFKPDKTVSQASATAPSMPTPPKAFTFGGTSITISPSNSTTPGPAAGGFKPDLAAVSSSSTTPSTFTFGQPDANRTKDIPNGSETKSSFSSTMPTKVSPFGGASSSSFTFGSTSTNISNKAFTPFGSGGGFGSASPFGKPSPTPAASSSASGSGSTGNSTLAPAFGSSSFGTSGFKFGAPGSSTFAFGSKPTSTDSKESGTADANEPVASSSKLAAPSASSSGEQDTASTTAKSPAPASTTPAVESRNGTPVSTGTGEDSKAPKEDNMVAKLLGENPNDLEGEGEEDEETLHTIRAKIFRFMKKEKEPTWAEFGVGMLRVKKHKTNGSFRLLSRNSANGKIMMNFKLYRGFKITHAKHVLNFMGHDCGEDAMFRVRVRDEPSAAALQEAVEKAVSTLKA